MTLDTGRELTMLHLDGRALPPAARLAAFSGIGRGYTATIPPASPEVFDFDARAWLLDDVAVTNSRLTALNIERTPAHILADGRTHLSFILLSHGSWTAAMEHGSIQVASGQVCIMDFAHGWTVEGTAQENIMLSMPRALIDELAPHAPALHGRILGGASGRLLAEHMFALARHLPATLTDDVAVVRQASVALVAAALTALPHSDDAPGRSVPRDVANRVLSHIERQLMDRGLSIDSICRDCAVGRATLYRALRPAGGIMSYIQRRRLEAAHARLSDPSERASLVDIAADYCFSSQAHFSTVFRRRFGYTPSRARRSGSGPRETQQRFAEWREAIASTLSTGVAAT